MLYRFLDLFFRVRPRIQTPVAKRKDSFVGTTIKIEDMVGHADERDSCEEMGDENEVANRSYRGIEVLEESTEGPKYSKNKAFSIEYDVDVNPDYTNVGICQH